MQRHRFTLDRAVATVVFTDRSDGSFALTEPADDLSRRRAAITPRSWLALQQVHGVGVVDGDRQPESGGASAPPIADAATVSRVGPAVSVLAADCAPVVLVGTTGVAVVHAGWRGAEAGVIDAAAAALRLSGATPVASLLGPCIQPGSYEFGEADLEPIAASFGPDVVARSRSGSPALDLTRVVQISCQRAGWPEPDRPACSSGEEFFSHRTRRDLGRQTAVAWLDDLPGGGSHV